jgi:hypothetical protein
MTAPPSLPSAIATASGDSPDAASTTITTPTDSVAPSDPPVPTVLPSDTSAAGGATSRPLFDKRRFAIRDGHLVKLTAAERKAIDPKYGKRPKESTGYANRRIDDRERGAIAVLKAAGLSNAETSRALRLRRTTVDHAVKTDALQAEMTRWRTLFRAQALEQAQAIQLKAWTLAEDALDAGDAKSFDAVTRGIAAMERTAASASGENKPAQVAVGVNVQTSLSADERDELLREFRKTLALDGEVVR